MEPVGTGRARICSSKRSYAYLVPARSHALWIYQNSGFVGHCGLSVKRLMLAKYGLVFACISCSRFHAVIELIYISSKWELGRISRWGHQSMSPGTWGSPELAPVQPHRFIPAVSPGWGNAWDGKISGFPFLSHVSSSSQYWSSLLTNTPATWKVRYKHTEIHNGELSIATKSL